ncbi:MAG: HDIG domain-containing protein [Thermoplasmatales archaeon]|nr:MAG: HDIG domain-containing protein [Thermoplasmatales archaeon]
MGSIPSREKCILLLKKSGCSNSVVKHCKAVGDIAVRMAKRAHADVELVEAGALLHDIGRSKTHGIFHATEGAKIARELGLSDKISNIIERHIGAGLPLQEAKKLGLPPKDYIPETIEEKIVCHADSLIDNFKQQKIENEIEKALIEGHKEYAKRLVKLHKELSNMCKMDVNNI